MKAHVSSDAESGLVHTVVGTAVSVHDGTCDHELRPGEESPMFANASY